MYFEKKRRAVPYSNLRSRLEEYSSLKEKTRWHGDEDLDSESDSAFNFFPLSILRDMHNFLLFKITLVLLAILVVFLCSFVKIPLTTSILQKIQYVTTWKMDFMEVGREVAPVIRKLWEGNLESNLEKVVMAPGGNILPDKELKFIAPLEGELEKTFGLKFNALLQKEEMFYGLVFNAPRGTYVRASASGRVLEIKEHPSYGLHLLLEHPVGMETFYGYLWEVLVEEGEEVKQGQKIARVGLDPLENKPALYFEIREKGEPIDPLPLLVGGAVNMKMRW
jgi:murein DD-endopeptidase MepM/ murein hydrolase activator NlpD